MVASNENPAAAGTARGASEADHLAKAVDPEVAQQPTEFQALTVAEWARGIRGMIRVRLDRFKGRDVVDVRYWWYDRHGDLKPGRPGFTVSVRHLPTLATAFAEASARARDLGLLPDQPSRPGDG